MNFLSESESDQSSLDINITPLIDIVFLLLIFFMVTTTFVESQSIQVDLPQASAKAPKSPPKQISVSVTADGKIFLEDSPVTRSELAAKLKERRTQGTPTLVLRADKKVEHGLTVEVMDTAKQAGFLQLAIATTPSG